MVVTTLDVTIEAYLNHNTIYESDASPDIVIPREHIKSLSFSARVGEVMDEFSLVLHNQDGRYTAEHPLQTGDRLVFVAQYDDGSVQRWTGRVQAVDASRQTPDIAEVSVSGVDYAGDIISDRLISRTYRNEDVGDIISDILDSKVPEVNSSSIGQLGVETDVSYSTHDAWDAIQRLAARADAVVIPDGLGLRVEGIGDLPYRFRVNTGDFYQPPSLSVDDDVKNVVRVDGGQERKLESEQTDHSYFTRVTETDRMTHQLRARKAQIHSIDIYVERVAEGESLIVRIQANEGGAPVDPDDEDSDIASAKWEADNLPSSGWQYFNIPEHTLPDRDPWVIIETDGETGHDVGRSPTNNLTHKSYYPFPINFEVQDPDSIREYGQRELQIDRGNIKTLVEARDEGEAELARRAWPTKTIEFEASSLRAHQLNPGDRIEIHRPFDGIDGEFIITEVDRTWDSSTVQVRTSISAEWRKGILAEVG